MDAAIQDAIDDTGMCIPLAARILRLLAESGASQMEISTALDLVNHLRHHLRASLVPEDVSSSWASPIDANRDDTT